MCQDGFPSILIIRHNLRLKFRKASFASDHFPNNRIQLYYPMFQAKVIFYLT